MTEFVQHGSNVDALMRIWDWWSGNQSLACFAVNSFSTTSSVGSPRNVTVNHTSLYSSLPELACCVEPDGMGLQATIEIFSRPSQTLESATLFEIVYTLTKFMVRTWFAVSHQQPVLCNSVCVALSYRLPPLHHRARLHGSECHPRRSCSHSTAAG